VTGSARLKTLALAAGLLLLAGLLALGARDIPSEAGYAGVGPSFLPWLVSAGLAVCALALGVGAVRRPEADLAADGPPPARLNLPAFVWVSAGLLLNAALITTLGFVVSCALLYGLAASGFRHAEGQRLSASGMVRDLLIGAVLSAPVFWLFTRALGLTLPAIVPGGWI
jgi:putative tricarboxylic transport membrane protein